MSAASQRRSVIALMSFVGSVATAGCSAILGLDEPAGSGTDAAAPADGTAGDSSADARTDGAGTHEAATDAPNAFETSTADAPPVDGDAAGETGGADAGNLDAADASADASDAAGPIDASEAGVACDAGTTLCGGTCVDLQTSSANCGACGYAVVGARTCVAAQPSPAWLAVTTTNEPTNAALVSIWTGKRILDIDDTGGVSSYDPSSDTWSSLTPPAGFSTSTIHRVALPDRNMAFVWTSSGAYLFDDTGASPTWTPISSGAPTSTSPAGGAVYTGASLVAVNTDGTGGRYDLATLNWVSIGAAPLVGGAGIGGVTFANGLVVAAEQNSQPSPNSYASEIPVFTLVPTAAAPSWSMQTAVAADYENIAEYGGLGYPTWLGFGNRVFALGGLDYVYHCTPGDFGVLDLPPTAYDPRAGVTDEALVAQLAIPANNVSSSFSYFTGNSILVFGGLQSSDPSGCGGSFPVAAFQGGSIAQVTASGNTLTWVPLPTSKQPSPRGLLGTGSLVPFSSNAQDLWTGREAIVFGGTDGTSTLNDGARYQPPVGCVCPINADAPSWFAGQCTGVTDVANPTCAPM